ncbi:hypothetical protein Tco_0882303 [Tanacetum coccineum]
MIGQDKDDEEDALIDILKIVVKECKSIYKKAQIPSSRTSKIQGVSFVAKEEEGESSKTLPYKQQSNEINPGGNFERIRDNPYSRNFEVYKDEFDNVIKQLENKYKLKIGRKRYTLEEVWDKCEKFHDSTKLWYDKGFEEEELCQNGIEEIDYTPPLVKSETFEVHRYTFKNRKSFISINLTQMEGHPYM